MRNVARLIMIGPVAFAEFDDDTDSEFYTDLFPAAAVILLAVPRKAKPGSKAVKLRLSTNAPAGLSLNALCLNEFDPGYGGRWNAGSNKRAGATDISTREYAEEVARRVNIAVKSNESTKST